MYINFDKKSGKALYIQLYEAICSDIVSGRLLCGMKLPSRRTLSEQLSISQNTVDGAYKMLVDTGYAISIPRQGYVVSFKPSVYIKNTPWEINAPEEVVFSPNGIDISRINRASYAKLVRDISYNDGKDIFSYADKGGEFELRSALSKYLYSFRGIKCAPDRIIIGAGAEYLLSSLAALFGSKNAFITENPCETHFYRVLSSYGHNVITLPLNSEKFDIDALYKSDGNILFTDPDARFPRSDAMDNNERQSLLDWAYSADNRYIIENCCDSEIMWDSHMPLYNMDNRGKVIYLGSFSRSFSPAVKTSYMVLPQELLLLWKNTHTYYYALTPKLEQFTLEALLSKGHFTKHYKAMRRLYREKRRLLEDCLTSSFGDAVSIYSCSGSTYITAVFKDKTPNEIKRLTRAGGVKLFSLNSYNIKKETEPVKDDRLVIGFGDLNREKIKLGITLIQNSLL